MRHQVNDTVYALRDLYEPVSDHSPGYQLCAYGDELVIRAVNPNSRYPYSTSHPDITDRSFGVTGAEISAMRHFTFNKP